MKLKTFIVILPLALLSLFAFSGVAEARSHVSTNFSLSLGNFFCPRPAVVERRYIVENYPVVYRAPVVYRQPVDLYPQPYERYVVYEAPRYYHQEVREVREVREVYMPRRACSAAGLSFSFGSRR